MSRERLKNIVRNVAAASLLAAWVLCAGCRAPDANPPAPRPNTGYVDFYTEATRDLSWDIKRVPDGGGKPVTVFYDIDPVPGTVLRVAAPPGLHQFQVWFINRATEGPRTVEVQVADGKVTPVHVRLVSTGIVSVDSKSYKTRPSATGPGRRVTITSSEHELYRIDAEAGSPEPYRPGQEMPYWSAAPAETPEATR